MSDGCREDWAAERQNRTHPAVNGLPWGGKRIAVTNKACNYGILWQILHPKPIYDLQAPFVDTGDYHPL